MKWLFTFCQTETGIHRASVLKQTCGEGEINVELIAAQYVSLPQSVFNIKDCFLTPFRDTFLLIQSVYL